MSPMSLHFEGDPGVPLSKLKGVLSVVPFLNFRIFPGPTFKL